MKMVPKQNITQFLKIVRNWHKRLLQVHCEMKRTL
jgi:hypothetical protein